MPVEKNVFASRLRAARKERGLTQHGLADLVRLERTMVSKMEARGGAKPSVDTLLALGKALGVSTDYLLGLSDSPIPAIPLLPAWVAGSLGRLARLDPVRAEVVQDIVGKAPKRRGDG
jgi:transcriptional regulator with XRE-family HTH domain